MIDIHPLEAYFSQQDEPVRSCLLFLRKHILGYDKNISEAWRYGMPFFFFKKKRFCYLWVHKKYHQPYIGVVDGTKLRRPDLILEKRTKMKIFLVDPLKDIPVKKIDSLLQEVLGLYS